MYKIIRTKKSKTREQLVKYYSSIIHHLEKNGREFVCYKFGISSLEVDNIIATFEKVKKRKINIAEDSAFSDAAACTFRIKKFFGKKDRAKLKK